MRDPVTYESDATSDITDTTTTDRIYNFDQAWLNSSLINTTLTVDIDNAKTITLVGDKIHNYLSTSANFTNTFCLEIKFPQTGSNKPNRLRVKATPTFTNDFSRGVTTRLLNVNLSTDFGNSICNQSTVEIVNGQEQTIAAGDSNYDGSVNATDISFVYKTADVCPGCLNFVTSSEVVLYEYAKFNDSDASKSVFRRVSTNDIDYSELILRIDTNSNSDSGQSSCVDSDCVAQGFDCCSNGQCIKEKELKTSGITADPTGFSVAEQKKYTDENWYKQYPQFYYICLESPPITEPDDSSDPVVDDPQTDAEDRLDSLTNDYNCIEELKTNSLANPFHTLPYNSSATYAACNVTDSTNTLYYEEVMKRLYSNCGCVEETNLTDMVTNCPKYEYTPIYETTNGGVTTTNIVAFSCYAPPIAQTPGPFQNLEVFVSSRSAPHRFFNSINQEINPYEELSSSITSTTQEGDEFKYLDDFSIFPQNGSFNMNSILGQMTVSLDQARPAYQIDIEFDKQYIISTLNGFYNQCPNCAKDSWFTSFGPQPFTNMGVGLRDIGYTTKRDEFGTNSSLGNYGDTKFGRACYLPPTMLPYAHSENTDAQTQRLNRLQTQAAMYVNGYQRDWYGFNRGALIASFDGVTWFAVGKGRIVRSTSTKLFLAINAPFADLATPTDHQVAVQEYDFSSTGAIYDYNPQEEINGFSQNEAGLCQKNHMCETDSDCVAKLGWEYTCADVSFQRTKWPQFDATTTLEEANTTKAVNQIATFLQQGTLPPGADTKRCVYRGAGAPCRVDYDQIADEGIRKNLTCAPNFYCANLATSNAFNNQVSRFARPLDELIVSNNHYFGMDANLLGRPLYYVTGSLTALPVEVQQNLEDNLSQVDSTAPTGVFGLCRPGKLLPSYQTIIATDDWEPEVQHRTADSQTRTDYISQIGGCNSTLYTNLRFSSCPAFDTDGNYIYTQDAYLNASNKEDTIQRFSFAQNSCGLESLDPSVTLTTLSNADTLQELSAFKTIEGKPLSSSNVIVEKTMARDACYRRAGSVCHTDLDCSPNKLQAQVVDLSPLSYFGNEAEKTYFEEYLVCGQARPEPTDPQDPNFLTYDITNNRCCREIGSDLTMFTENSPRDTRSSNLNTARFSSIAPTASDRYSRYAVVDATITPGFTEATFLTRPSAHAIDSDGDKDIDACTGCNSDITTSNQWATIYDGGSKTCCGGGWVRKFEDGTNDWTINRLNFNIANFKCLNFYSPLYLYPDNPQTPFGFTQNQLDTDRNSLCVDSARQEAGCAQLSFRDITSFTSLRKPRPNRETGAQFVTTEKDVMDPLWDDNLFAFHQIFESGTTSTTQVGQIRQGINLNWSDGDPGDTDNPPDEDTDIRKGFLFRLPSWVTLVDAVGATDEIQQIGLRMTMPNTSRTQQVAADNATISTPYPAPLATTDSTAIYCQYIGATVATFQTTPANGDPWGGSCPGDATEANLRCCYTYDPITRLIQVAYSTLDTQEVNNYGDEDIFIKFNYIAAGTQAYEENRIANTVLIDDTSVIDHRRGIDPESVPDSLYYLEKLSRLEYVGIPNIYYEPLFCSDNYQKLVPGIFQEATAGGPLNNIADFINHPDTFRVNGASPWRSDTAAGNYDADTVNESLAATQDLLQIQPIFSDNQFKCCRELGTVLEPGDSDALCCSGYTVDTSTATQDSKTCMLPPGTDLHVYFNKFISSEGLEQNSLIDNPLEVTDFDSTTGEPRLTAEVTSKLTVIGELFCESRSVRTGGAFGNFLSSPLAPVTISNDTKFTIVDELTDRDTGGGTERGATTFNNGFRWNHHLYCDELN